MCALHARWKFFAVCFCFFVFSIGWRVQKHKIDFVYHAFANEDDATKQSSFYAVPQAMGIFKTVRFFVCVTTRVLNAVLGRSRTITACRPLRSLRTTRGKAFGA